MNRRVHLSQPDLDNTGLESLIELLTRVARRQAGQECARALAPAAALMSL